MCLFNRIEVRASYGPWVTTDNHIHDNVIVDHDSTGKIGGVADYNWSGMAYGGSTWTNNDYFMPDEGNRFSWGSTYNFKDFQVASGESGTISQACPSTEDWLDLSKYKNAGPRQASN